MIGSGQVAGTVSRCAPAPHLAAARQQFETCQDNGDVRMVRAHPDAAGRDSPAKEICGPLRLAEIRVADSQVVQRLHAIRVLFAEHCGAPVQHVGQQRQRFLGAARPEQVDGQVVRALERSGMVRAQNLVI